MFWSKIWFFLVAVAAAVALTIALVLPRPAARAMVTEEHRRLSVACGVIGILLTDDARKRVDLASAFARTDEIRELLAAASGADRLDEARMKSTRAKAETVMKGIQGDRQPDFAMLIEKRGRVVARVKLDDKVFGDLAAGRPLVDDALAGYLRDDLWLMKDTLYFVSAAPVVRVGGEYVGAVVLGHQVTNELAKKLSGSLSVDAAFFAGDGTVASSRTIALDQGALLRGLRALTGDPTEDCRRAPFSLRASGEDLTAVVARLPGEAGAAQAFYTVFIRRPVGLGFFATLKAVTQDDLSFGGFPWIFVGGGLLLVLAGGIVLMLLEADRPLRRLVGDAVRLAKGDVERLGEDAHPGKFGSIARSVNIYIDRVGREAKATTKKDIDQLLGPAPEGSLGTIDLLATALPAARPGGSGPIAAAPPSDFKFGESGSRPAIPARNTPQPFPAQAPPSTRNTPPPFPAQAPPTRNTPPPMPAVAPPRAPTPLPVAEPDADELLEEEAEPIDAAEAAGPSPDRSDPYYKSVFDQFVALKKSCNESIAGLTYDKFVGKLIRNRDELRAKTGCREVRFTVYVKDGKAALKATPVKDE